MTDSSPKQFKGNILLVEDNKSNQIVTGFLIEEFGLSFDIANNGQEAVDLVNQGNHYDLILMDLQMPIMDGFVATRTIRAYSSATQSIVALSGCDSEDDRTKAKKAGMNGFINKPVEPEKLEKIFTRYLS